MTKGQPGRSAEFDRELLAAVPKVRPYAHRLAGQNAEDLMQDALVKALSSGDKFQAETQMAAWLRTIVHHAHVSQRRKTWREEALSDLAAEMIPARESQHDRLETTEVLQAVYALPAGQRPIMESVMLGFGLEEAAQYRGVAIATAKNQLYRGREALRRKFG